MPRPPRFRISRLDDLFRQIAFASADARRRQIRASEILLDEIKPDHTYAADLVAHRITGFRPERRAAGRDSSAAEELLVGDALIADLAVFVLRLSEHVLLRPEERPGGAAPLGALSAELGVTHRTLQRWRRLGLPTHWIDFGGQRQLGCYRAALEAFLRRRPDVRNRRSATRLRPEEKARLVEEARSIRAAGGGSLSSVAAEVAARHGRAHETVRLLLERHDARAAPPIFSGLAVDRAPLDERDRRFVERAWRLGAPLARIAAHLGRSVPAVHRQLMVRRRERLAGLRLRWIELPTFSMPEADEVILAAPPVRERLVRLAGTEDAMALLPGLRTGFTEHAGAVQASRPRAGGRGGRRSIQPAVEAFPPEELARAEALVAAWNFLKRRAAGAIAAIEPVPAAGPVDAVERDLRWAALVQQSLMAMALREALRRADLWAGRRIEELGGEELRSTIAILVGVSARVIDRVDPSRGNRLDRLVALDVDKALARRASPATIAGRDGARARAAAGHAGGAVRLHGVFDAISPWQAWLDPPSRWRERLDRLPPEQRRAVELVHGLDGCAPRAIGDVARDLGVSPSAARRLASDGEARLRRDA